MKDNKTNSTEKKTETVVKKLDDYKKKPEKETPQAEAKSEKPKIPKKHEAVAKGVGMHISKKHAVYICSFIKNKQIDKAISDLEEVIKFKKPIPFKGEIPHRKGKIMSGRYPIKASKLFITLLKGLKGNAIVNQMDLDNTKITLASATWASRPMRRGNVEGKRTNVLLKAKEIKPTFKKSE